MLHFIITIAVCGAVLWTASAAVVLAFAYAASPRRTQPATTAKDRTNAR